MLIYTHPRCGAQMWFTSTVVADEYTGTPARYDCECVRVDYLASACVLMSPLCLLHLICGDDSRLASHLASRCTTTCECPVATNPRRGAFVSCAVTDDLTWMGWQPVPSTSLEHV